MWSDHEEALLQQERKRGWVLLAGFAVFVALGVVAFVTGNAAAIVLALVALAATALLDNRWNLDSNVTQAWGRERRERKAARRQRRQRREEAIRTGSWAPHR